MTDRPRERLLALGGDRASLQDLLAVILGTGSRGRSAEALAAELLRRAGGLAGLSRASPRELTGISGIGDARALRVTAAFHLGRRAGEVAHEHDPLVTAEDVWRRLRGRVAAMPQEVFVVIGIDARNVVLEELEVARGTLTSVDVHPREVFRPLIRMSAAAAVVAHNHPSGDPHPSPEDIELTRRLREVGAVVGIPIVDHIVLGSRGFTSMAEWMGIEF